MNLSDNWWIYAGIALFIWWLLWRDRYYPYEKRALIISRALREQSDLSMTYWAKSSHQYSNRVVTPLSLEGRYLRAYDHMRKDERTFKVTRIKEIALVPRSKTADGKII
jgi:predicted DNA-binding transcriptional regulator YafY